MVVDLRRAVAGGKCTQGDVSVPRRVKAGIKA